MNALTQRELLRTVARGRPGPVGPVPIPAWSNEVNLYFKDANGDPLSLPVNLQGPEGPAGEFQNFKTRATAAAAIISPLLTRIRIWRYDSASRASPADYVQGTGPLTFTDDGGVSWQLDLLSADLVLTAAMCGAPNNGVDYDDAAIRRLNTVLALGICKRARWSGSFRVYETLADTVATLINLNNVHGLVFEYVAATFICNADQLALRSGLNWSNSFFTFQDCKYFRAIGIPTFIGNITKTSLKTVGSAYGMVGLQFIGNCSGVTLDGAYGDGILCPVLFAHDTSTVQCSTDKPIMAVRGSGYTAGDALSLVGGAGSLSALLTVDSVDGGGGINGLSWTGIGRYPEGTIPVFAPSNNGYALTGGSGAGARAYLYMERAFEDEHTVGGTAGYVKARYCFYPYVQRDSGDYLTATVDADYCYRAIFVYGGIIGARIHTTLRHIYRTAVIFGGGYHALGNQDCYFHVKMLPATEPGYSSGDCVCRPTFNQANPVKVSVHLDVDLNYGYLALRAANFMEISKYHLNIPDDHPRGHDLKLKWTGHINGFSDIGSADAGGTHLSMINYTWLGEFFGGWEIGPLDIEGGGNIIVDPRAFPNAGLPGDPDFIKTKGGVHFDVVNPDGYVTFNETLTGTTYRDGAQSRCAISVSNRSRFKNRGGTVGGSIPATIGCIDYSGTLTLLPGWHNHVIKANGGTGAIVTRNLSAIPFEGLRFEVQNSGGAGGTVVRLVPPPSHNFDNRAAGKYLDLALGATVVIECTAVVADNGVYSWSVVRSNGGTLTYQS